ncbi:flagellar hook-basal body complex protein FliE [Clostridium sp. NSJ-6]|uniref:Flagellar hook-basal body complex protein FliE n=1 Tax=Clostridium hominis TaxID=2763036 RepID=A0ABR7DHP5_9CLOT|nr:flagellar hook-basal body complex protein FliE [Clostridium hominis]MBC5630944.1 flagellar hook-basal body complex protein FliE [Clostridium hominis]
MNIQSIGSSSLLNNIGMQSLEKNIDEKKSFSDVISNAINNVNEKQINADNSIESLIKGDDITMHEVMLSMQESQLSMQLLIEVRNKMVEAYQEINKIQL